MTDATSSLSHETIRDSSLYNKDLAPIPTERRTWSTYNYAALWISMSVNIPTYMLASGMIAGGMNWKQALFTVFLGNLLVLVPMLLNAHAGAQIRDSVPGFRSRLVRRAGRECARRVARAGRLRMVWNSDLDRRRSDQCHDHRARAVLGAFHRRASGLLCFFLVAERRSDPARHRYHSVFAGRLRAPPVGDGTRLVALGRLEGRRFWANARRLLRNSPPSANFSDFLSRH